MSAAALELAKELIGSAVLSTSSYMGDEMITVEPAQIFESMRRLRDDLRMNFLVDLSCVDYLAMPGHIGARFEVVYHLRSTETNERLRIKAPLALPEDGSYPQIQSLVALWPGANWLEREVWDLYGIKFIDHPDLRRILMYEEFKGHPLRKDYPKEKRQPLVRRIENG